MVDLKKLKKKDEPFWHRCVGNRRGQALAETAIAVTLLILLVMGVIEFGRAFMVANMVTHAARDGARSAAVVPTTQRDSVGTINSSTKTSIQNQVRNMVAGVVGASVASGLTIAVTQSGSPAAPPPLVTVSITGNIPTALNWAGFSSFPVNRSVTFRDEGR